MVDQKRPGCPITLDDVVEPLGKPGFDQDFGNLQCTERRVFRRLEHHRIAGGKRRRTLPAGDLLRIVPGADTDADAERYPLRIGKIAAERDILAVQARSDHAAEKFEAVGTRSRIGDDRFLDRLAGIERFEFGKFAVPLAHDFGGTLEDSAARRRAHCRPFRLGAFGRCDRLFDNRRRCRMQPCDHLAGGGVKALDDAACGILHIFAVDEVAGFRLCFHSLVSAQ
ncbi:hypothetical protein D3C80_395700 [compost metagenome]